MTVIAITSDDSTTVFFAGRPFVVSSDNARYAELREAIANEDHDLIETIVNASDRLAKLLGQYGDVKVFAGRVTFQDRPVSNFLVDRILQLMNRGRDPGPYALFLDRVMRNPTRQAVDDLFGWVERAKLPILPDGRFLAYRRVRDSYLDCHSGTMDNSPGRVVSIPRDQTDTNPNKQCSRGLHFCNFNYLSSFNGDRLLVMAEDPENVVSFPRDHDGSKGRTESHEVLFELDPKWLHQDFFATEFPDHVVFDFEQVEQYQREQLRLQVNPDELEAAFHAYDAGYRVFHDPDTTTNGDGEWDVVAPDGSVCASFESRRSALQFMATRGQHMLECAVEDEPVDELTVMVGIAIMGSPEEANDTFNSRLEALETALNITESAGDTFSDRLYVIERELGLTDDTPPQINRLQRAEAAAGIG